MKSFKLFLFLLFISYQHLSLAAIDTVELSLSKDFHSLAERAYFFEDQKGLLTIEDIQQLSIEGQLQYSEGEALSFGLQSSPFWFYTQLQNASAHQKTWWLEFQDPLFDHVEYFIIRADGTMETFTVGEREPFYQRSVKHRHPIVSIEFAPNEVVDVYARLRNQAVMRFPVYAWQPFEFGERDHEEQFIYGLYYGLMVALLLYNLMIFISIRNLNYLYYCCFVAGAVPLHFSLNGLGYEYLWPDGMWLTPQLVVLLTALTNFTSLQFSDAFLRAKETMPWMHQWYRFLQAINLVIIIVSLAIDRPQLIYIVTIMSVISTGSALAGGFVAYFKGLREARFYLPAWTVLLLGAMTYSLMIAGFIPRNLFTLYSMQIGAALEALLLSFALADRLRYLTTENIRIETEARAQLEERVEERTLELNDALDELNVANEKLQELNYIDGLTGIKNRKYLDEHIAIYWRDSLREQKSLSVIMVDIDHFKAINDTYGHLAGDHVIKVIANVVDEQMHRPRDIITRTQNEAFNQTGFAARYGGEEFCILLPNTDTEGAAYIAEKIRKAVEELAVNFEEQEIQVTISLGCSTHNDTFQAKSVSQLLQRADRAFVRGEARRKKSGLFSS